MLHTSNLGMDIACHLREPDELVQVEVQTAGEQVRAHCDRGAEVRGSLDALRSRRWEPGPVVACLVSDLPHDELEKLQVVAGAEQGGGHLLVLFSNLGADVRDPQGADHVRLVLAVGVTKVALSLGVSRAGIFDIGLVRGLLGVDVVRVVVLAGLRVLEHLLSALDREELPVSFGVVATLVGVVLESSYLIGLLDLLGGGDGGNVEVAVQVSLQNVGRDNGSHDEDE